MKTELTERQNEILCFIQESIEDNGYPPTYREIGQKFDIASTFGVKRHVDALIKKGYLNNESKTSRTLSLAKNGELKNHTISNEQLIEIPIVGRVAAGYPILAEENVEGTLAIAASLISKNTNCFGLKVRGDSMIKAGIIEGDMVIVSQQKNVKNGDIIVALLGDEATLKTFSKKDEIINLIPQNDKYPIIEINNREDFSIVGKVVSVFRIYN